MRIGLPRRHDRGRCEIHVVEIRVRVDVGLAVDDLRLEQRQPGCAVAQPAPRIAMPEIVKEYSHGEIHAGAGDRRLIVCRIRCRFDALERGAFPEVVGKGTRVGAGIVWELCYSLSTPRLDCVCQPIEFTLARYC